MTNQTFQTIQKSVANQPHGPRKPLTGFYVSTTATGSNAAATEIIRTAVKQR